MYPVHWFERVSDDVNYGFSIASPLWFQGMGDVRGFLVRTDDDLSEADAFSVCTDIYNATEINNYDVKMVIRHSNIEVLADFHSLSDGASCDLGGDVQYEAIFKVTEDRSGSTSSGGNYKQYTYHYSYKFGYSCPVCMMYYGGKFHFYVGREELIADSVEDIEQLSEWYETAGLPTTPIDLSADGGQYICVRGDGGYVQHFRYYDRKMSTLQRLEDYSWPVLHYLFDGLEADESGNCTIEHDVTGSYPYDLTVTGDPMVVSNAGNHLRDKSMTIPDGCVVDISPPGYNQCFVNFWVRFESDARNGTLYEHGSNQALIDYRYTDTGYLLDFFLTTSDVGGGEYDGGDDTDDTLDGGMDSMDDWDNAGSDDSTDSSDGTSSSDDNLGLDDIGDGDLGDLGDGEGDIIEAYEGYFVKSSTWAMISVYCQVNYDGTCTVEYLLNGELIGTSKCDTAESAESGWFCNNPIKIHPFPGSISDFRVYLRKPTNEELTYLLNGEVLIDDRCTFCASKLTVNENIETFGFSKGEILAKGFDFLEEEDENSASFDPSDGILRIKDFKQT